MDCDDSFEEFVFFKKSQRDNTNNEDKLAVLVRSSSPPVHTSSPPPPPSAHSSVVDALEGKANFELMYSLDAWLEPLQNYTAPTRFVHLSLEEVKALLQKQEDGVTKSVEERLNEEIRTHFSKSGCFAKLHTRSAKDGVTTLENMCDIVENRMVKTPALCSASKRREISNSDARLISTVARELFRVDSAKTILELFRKSSRVRSDLQKAVTAKRGSVIVLRRFGLCKPEFEFRCFVYGRNLTGCSQYCHGVFFPELIKRRDAIEKAISAFFEKTAPLYPMENFICDVFLKWEEKDPLPQVEIIELNPFFNDTGALLFDWKNQRDRDILGGREKMEFRFVEHVQDDPYDFLPFEWREWLKKQRRWK